MDLKSFSNLISPKYAKSEIISENDSKILINEIVISNIVKLDNNKESE